MDQFKSKWDTWSVPVDATDKTEVFGKSSSSANCDFKSFDPNLADVSIGIAFREIKQYYLKGIFEYGVSHCSSLLRDIASAEDQAEKECLKYLERKTATKTMVEALQKWVDLHKELSLKYRRYLEVSRKEATHG